MANANPVALRTQSIVRCLFLMVFVSSFSKFSKAIFGRLFSKRLQIHWSLGDEHELANDGSLWRRGCLDGKYYAG
jgi:hypothetical protein